jgi:tetratricopeptide (TPR) repeat protein
MLGRKALVLITFSLTLRCAAAQAAGQSAQPVASPCTALNQATLAQAASGRLQEAEAALSVASSGGRPFALMCAGLVLNNIATLMETSGRLDEARNFAERSVTILEKIYPPDDPILLRPLQIVAVASFEQGKTARAREAFQRMRAIRIERPSDRALVHSMGAALLHAQGMGREAESEYFAAFNALEEAGRGSTADAGAVLNGLTKLYLEQQKLDEARRTLDRAVNIFASANDAVPMDRIKLLNVRAVLHARQGQWIEAEQDLHDAVTMADHESRVDPAILNPLLINYAQVLRKNRHRREARMIEARANYWPAAIVDITEIPRQRLLENHP